MRIRKATRIDKKYVLDFCKNTFSWGDYIEDVWDFWITEGNLFVIETVNPVGICHAYHLGDSLWIEGIRIHPLHRKKGFASRLVSHVEYLASKDTKTSSMLIDVKNNPSLIMAKNLGYTISSKWNFYSLLPKQTKNFSVMFRDLPHNPSMDQYVKSWRWKPLTDADMKYLLDNNQIICSGKNRHSSFAIITDSEHFEKTMLVTLYSGSQENDLEILSYVQNFCFANKYNRVQILTKGILSLPVVEHRMSFYLMSKSLS